MLHTVGKIKELDVCGSLVLSNSVTFIFVLPCRAPVISNLITLRLDSSPIVIISYM